MRSVYRRRDLQRLFSPQSVALVGVSSKPGSFGGATFANFRNYKGRLSVIHPGGKAFGDCPTWSSIAAMPEAPDLVLLSTPRETVEGLVRECADRGVGGVVVYASGYHETGKPERSELQQRLVDIARAADMRLLGPNTMGFFNVGLGANASFMSPDFTIPAPAPQSIGLVCQSGAVAFGMLLASQRGVSFSHVLTAGNSSDVDVFDEIAYLAEEDGCASILCLFEGNHDPERMREAGRIAWENDKPLIVFKMATGTIGVEASKAHTRTRAGDLEAYRRAIEDTGMIEVEDYETLVETAAFFAKVPRPRGKGVFIFSASGGAGIIAADKAEATGLELPQPNAETKALLDQYVPEYGSTRNPCDVTATLGANLEATAACYDALMADPACGVVITTLCQPGPIVPGRLVPLGAAARKHGKFACALWLSGWLEGTGSTEAEGNPDVALFRSVRGCFAAIRHWLRREERRQAS